MRLRSAALLVMAALTVLGLLAACSNADTPDERADAPGKTADPTPAGSRNPSAPGPDTRIRTHAADPTAVAQAARPSKLQIDAVDLDLPVLAVGVAADGQMALPPDPATIGWYEFGPGPSDDKGSVVLGGHVDSKQYGAGPLVRLHQVRAGDRIVLRSTDGSAAQYRVRTVEDVRKSRLALGEVFDRDGPPQLRIITCGGPYDDNGGGYRDNLVVTAAPTR